MPPEAKCDGIIAGSPGERNQRGKSRCSATVRPPAPAWAQRPAAGGRGLRALQRAGLPAAGVVGPEAAATPLHGTLATRTGLRPIELVLLERTTRLPAFQEGCDRVWHSGHDSANADRLSRNASDGPKKCTLPLFESNQVRAWLAVWPSRNHAHDSHRLPRIETALLEPLSEGGGQRPHVDDAPALIGKRRDGDAVFPEVGNIKCEHHDHPLCATSEQDPRHDKERSEVLPLRHRMAARHEASR
jgi:hypothetical protein